MEPSLCMVEVGIFRIQKLIQTPRAILCFLGLPILWDGERAESLNQTGPNKQQITRQMIADL